MGIPSPIEDIERVSSTRNLDYVRRTEINFWIYDEVAYWGYWWVFHWKLRVCSDEEFWAKIRWDLEMENLLHDVGGDTLDLKIEKWIFGELQSCVCMVKFDGGIRWFSRVDLVETMLCWCLSGDPRSYRCKWLRCLLILKEKWNDSMNVVQSNIYKF